MVSGAAEAAGAAGVATHAPGVFTGEAESVVGEVLKAMPKHRVWERFA